MAAPAGLVRRQQAQARTWMQAATRTAKDMDCPATTGSRCVSRALAMPRRATSPRLAAYLRRGSRGGGGRGGGLWLVQGGALNVPALGQERGLAHRWGQPRVDSMEVRC